jgi:hypothetical protein
VIWGLGWGVEFFLPQATVRLQFDEAVFMCHQVFKGSPPWVSLCVETAHQGVYGQ